MKTYLHRSSNILQLFKNSKMFINNLPPASWNWVAHIRRDFFTCCFCCYYSSMMRHIGVKIDLQKNVRRNILREWQWHHFFDYTTSPCKTFYEWNPLPFFLSDILFELPLCKINVYIIYIISKFTSKNYIQ